MEAVASDTVDGKEKLTHCCVRCGKIRKNKVQTEDDFEALLALARKRVAKS